MPPLPEQPPPQQPPPPPSTKVSTFSLSKYKISSKISTSINILLTWQISGNKQTTAVKPMAQLVKDYDFGFPLRNVQQLDAIEQNILTDDKYATSLVSSQYKFPFNIFIIFSNQNYPHLNQQKKKIFKMHRRRQRRKRNISRFCLHLFDQTKF